MNGDATSLTSGSLINTLDYEYDLGNQLTGTSDSNSQYAFTYDDLGRVLTVSNSGTSGVPTVVLTNLFDASSNRTSVSSTIGGTNDYKNDYTFDGLNRMTRVDQQSNGGNSVAEKRVDFSYNALGQFTTIARYKDIDGGSTNEVATSTFSYDNLERLTDLAYTKGGSNLFTAYSWTFDALSRITDVTSQDGTTSYTYDSTSQLTGADHSYQTDESYSYDANGNRNMSGWSTGTNNQLTNDGTYSYTYDHEGNRTKRTKTSDSSYTEYTWDYRNRLTNATEKNSSNTVLSTVDYTYDTFDRRIEKSYDADGPGSGAAVVTRYVYDGDNIALQFDGSSNLTHRYLHGPAVDQILADEQIGGTLLWPLTDNLGTVRDLVNSSGTVQNHLKYDSFGKVTAESNSAVDHIYAFTGRERDEETGLQYHRARYLDVAVGRWVSEDPTGIDAGDVNLARYVNNSPTSYVDSTGLIKRPPPLPFPFSDTPGTVSVTADVGDVPSVVPGQYCPAALPPRRPPPATGGINASTWYWTNPAYGTPILPRPVGPGVNINIYGEGENPQFEDYAANPFYATGTNGKTRPVTQSLPDHSVANIVIRNSPVSSITWEEIVRLIRPRGTVTFAGPSQVIGRLFSRISNEELVNEYATITPPVLVHWVSTQQGPINVSAFTVTFGPNPPQYIGPKNVTDTSDITYTREKHPLP
jgi:RHS repeat-associated protein